MEAHKEAHVREAIRGLRVIWGSKGAKLIPLREMVDAITVNRKATAALGMPHLSWQPASCNPSQTSGSTLDLSMHMVYLSCWY